jgi:hypothetical protein
MASVRNAVVAAAHAASDAPSAIRHRLPPPERVLYYTGLGALAALDVLSWPLAGAIGAGVWVATRNRTTTA